MYRILKVLNNNGILALNSENGKETILLGKGVGFGRHAGERLQQIGEARKYELVTQRYSALQQVNSIEPQFIEMTARIMDQAEQTLGALRPDILIPMADHIALAVKRAKEQTELPNPLKQDIQALFEREYQAALVGRNIIREMSGVEISEDEVGYITLHIHSGMSEDNVASSLEMARLVQEGIRQIEQGLNIELKTTSLGYNRLVSHMRYMIARTRSGERVNLDMEDYAKSNFPDMYRIAENICRYMEQEMRMKIAQEEVGFLAIHIKRVSQRE